MVWTLFVCVLSLECVVDIVWPDCAMVLFGLLASACACPAVSLVLVACVGSFVPSVVVRFRLFSSVCPFALVWFLFLMVMWGLSNQNDYSEPLILR